MHTPPTTAEAPILVLLPTFNGDAFLERQIDSILQQVGAATTILLRDDGSTDGTPALLHRYARDYPDRVRVLPPSAPTGSAAGNVRLLLQHATGDAAYTALADQDDVWLSHKLRQSMAAMRALEQAHGTTAPLLVFADMIVVDRELATIAPSLWRHNGIDPATVHRLPRLLSENVVTGATTLMNASLARLAAAMPQDAAVMHDHWIALVASALGHATGLAEPSVLYRQHGGNVVGASTSDDSLSGRVTRLTSRASTANRKAARRRTERQAALFLSTYADKLSPATRTMLSDYAALSAGTRAQELVSIVRHGFWRGTIERNAATLLDLLR